jgi:hypothetical protein
MLGSLSRSRPLREIPLSASFLFAPVAFVLLVFRKRPCESKDILSSSREREGGSTAT